MLLLEVSKFTGFCMASYFFILLVALIGIVLCYEFIHFYCYCYLFLICGAIPCLRVDLISRSNHSVCCVHREDWEWSWDFSLKYENSHMLFPYFSRDGNCSPSFLLAFLDYYFTTPSQHNITSRQIRPLLLCWLVGWACCIVISAKISPLTYLPQTQVHFPVNKWLLPLSIQVSIEFLFHFFSQQRNHSDSHIRNIIEPS